MDLAVQLGPILSNLFWIKSATILNCHAKKTFPWVSPASVEFVHKALTCCVRKKNCSPQTQKTIAQCMNISLHGAAISEPRTTCFEMNTKHKHPCANRPWTQQYNLESNPQILSASNLQQFWIVAMVRRHIVGSIEIQWKLLELKDVQQRESERCSWLQMELPHKTIRVTWWMQELQLTCEGRGCERGLDHPDDDILQTYLPARLEEVKVELRTRVRTTLFADLHISVALMCSCTLLYSSLLLEFSNSGISKWM